MVGYIGFNASVTSYTCLYCRHIPGSKEAKLGVSIAEEAEEKRKLVEELFLLNNSKRGLWLFGMGIAAPISLLINQSMNQTFHYNRYIYR